MALVTLAQAKDYLKIIHDFDDADIQLSLDAAHDEAIQFLNYNKLSEFEAYLLSPENIFDPIPASVQLGILALLEANYEAGVKDTEGLRKIAEVKLMPFRILLGV